MQGRRDVESDERDVKTFADSPSTMAPIAVPSHFLALSVVASDSTSIGKGITQTDLKEDVDSVKRSPVDDTLGLSELDAEALVACTQKLGLLVHRIERAHATMTTKIPIVEQKFIMPIAVDFARSNPLIARKRTRTGCLSKSLNLDLVKIQLD